MIEWYKQFYSFDYRATRTEYWIFWAAQLVLGFAVWAVMIAAIAMILGAGFTLSVQKMVASILEQGIGFGTGIQLRILAVVLVIVNWLLFAWPTLATTARRLHDFNLSGWWQIGFMILLLFLHYYGAKIEHAFLNSGGLYSAVIIIGLWVAWIVALYFVRGTKGPNRYGADPRESAAYVKLRLKEKRRELKDAQR